MRADGGCRQGLPHCSSMVETSCSGWPAADQVGGDAGRAAGPGPAHVAVAGVDPEIGQRTAAEDRQVVGRHRPQARPIAGPVIVAGVREQLVRRPQHGREVGRPVRPVVAGELGDGGHPHPVAIVGEGEQVVLVDAGQGRRVVAALDRQRHRIALDRVDRQVEADASARRARSGSRAPARRRRRRRHPGRSAPWSPGRRPHRCRGWCGRGAARRRGRRANRRGPA